MIQTFGELNRKDKKEVLLLMDENDNTGKEMQLLIGESKLVKQNKKNKMRRMMSRRMEMKQAPS